MRSAVSKLSPVYRRQRSDKSHETNFDVYEDTRRELSDCPTERGNAEREGETATEA